MRILDTFKSKKKEGERVETMKEPKEGKVQSVEELDNEIKNKLKDITHDDLINGIIKHAKKNGHTFDTPEYAKKWAQRYLEKEVTKDRLRMGTPILCNVCGKYGSNKKTGPLRRDIDGGYKHEHCK